MCEASILDVALLEFIGVCALLAAVPNDDLLINYSFVEAALFSIILSSSDTLSLSRAVLDEQNSHMREFFLVTDFVILVTDWFFFRYAAHLTQRLCPQFIIKISNGISMHLEQAMGVSESIIFLSIYVN